MFDWEETVMDDTQIADCVLSIPASETEVDVGHRRQALRLVAQAQAEISFTAGQEGERAKVRGIYTDANDLKELEDRVKEYLEG